MKKILLLLAALPPVFVAAQQVTPAMKASFDHLIDSRYRADAPGGTVLIAQKGKVLYERGLGIANLELNVKMQPDMLFEIGSQTKQFTAICILQLMEQGKLAVTDPISRYLQDAPASWQQVTIENLLTHSSGINEVPNGGNMPVAEKIKVSQNLPLAFVPGTKSSYVNFEYSLLGAIVEKVAGQPLGKYVKDHILDPIGMKHTYWNDYNGIIPNRTPAYLKRSAGFTNVTNIPPPDGAGGLISNTYDMLTWYEALAAGKVVKKETLKQAWKPHILADGKASTFGYGWMAGGAVQGSPISEHSGMMGGYCTESLYMPEEQIFVAVFINQRGYPDPTAQELAAILIGKPYLADSIQMSADELKTYTGTYEVGEGDKRIMSFSNGKLYYEPNGRAGKIQMIPYEKDKFNADITMWSFIFHRDATGNIISVTRFDKRYYNPSGQFWKKVQ
ncbi:MAG: serine hydrolase domain-containing protein [Bacteroidota bacterium]